MPHTPELSSIAHRAVRPSVAPVAWAHVIFIGKVADHFGRNREVAIPAGGCPLSRLRARLAQDVEGGAEALAEPGLQMEVGQALCSESVWVTPGQEVAFFSVFSGD